MIFRKLLLPFTLVTFGIIISLLLCEVGFRLLVTPPSRRKGWDDRPQLYFSQERAQSAQDYYHPKEKAPGTFRVVVVGDSFTFGFGNLMDDAFPQRLERILNLNEHQTKVEVLNLGTPGFSTQDESKTIENALKNLSPDLVVLEITLNDPEIKPYNETHPAMRDKMGGFVLTGGIYNYWKSLAWVAARIRNARSYEEYKDYFLGLFTNPDTLENFHSGLVKIDTSCRNAHVPWVSMVFPLFAFPLDKNYPFTPAHETVHRLLNELKVPWLDLYENYKGIPPERLEAEPALDPHPNEIAHRIAAEALFKWLTLHDYIPKDAIPALIGTKRPGLNPPPPHAVWPPH